MAGTVKADIVQCEQATPTVFRNGSGTEIGRFVRVFINYGAPTTVTRGSFNVSSLVKNGTGDFTTNFTTSLVDANYSASLSASGPVNSNHCVPFFCGPGGDDTANHNVSWIRQSQYVVSNSTLRGDAAMFNITIVR